MGMNVVTDMAFRNLLGYCAACIPSFSTIPQSLPLSGAIVKAWILELYNKSLPVVIRSMREGLTSIHFSFDIWTGSNRRSYLGVTAHWVDKERDEKALLLGLERLFGSNSHSGENQAAVFWRIAKHFTVERLIGYFTLDNASNNDTALLAISRHLQRIGIHDFDPEQRRICCYGHVLNLVVKAFLYGSDEELLELAIIERGEDDEITAEDFEFELAAWKKLGPLGKLHNALTFIRGSPQRLDRFSTVIHETYPAAGKVISTVPIVGNLTR